MKKKTAIRPSLARNSSLSKIKRCSSLSELSISEIQQLKTTQDSIDFQQERQLITDFIKKVDQSANQYGLQAKMMENMPKQQNLNCLEGFEKGKKNVPKKETSLLERQKRTSLCFDHEIKRKKLSKKYKLNSKILISKSKRCLEKCSKEKNKKLCFEDRFLPQKPLQIALPIDSPHKNFAKTKILSKVVQRPLNFQKKNDQQDNFSKIYHLREDQIKQQINDININTFFGNSSFSECRMEKSQSLAPKINDFKEEKKMPFEKEKSFDYYYDKKILKNSAVGCQPKIFQVRRPLSVDINKVHSIRKIFQVTQDSPFSRDSSSTGTQKAIKKPSMIQSHRNQFSNRKDSGNYMFRSHHWRNNI